MQFHQLNQKQLGLIAIGTLMASALVAIGVSVAMPHDETVSVARPKAPSIIGRLVGPTDIPGETEEQKRERILREEFERGGRIINLAAETRGQLVTIAGRQVRFPSDAYVEGWITNISCLAVDSKRPAEPCAEAPAYHIRRGQSSISVGALTGRINGEQLAPGEEHFFDFLKDALR
jgi:hypothetical protein